MMFDGTFGSLDKHQLVALVSCLVPVDRSNVRVLLRCHWFHFNWCCGWVVRV